MAVFNEFVKQRLLHKVGEKNEGWRFGSGILSGSGSGSKKLGSGRQSWVIETVDSQSMLAEAFKP